MVGLMVVVFLTPKTLQLWLLKAVASHEKTNNANKKNDLVNVC